MVLQKIRVHEHYVADSHYNDIALLRLATPIKGWTQGIWPICMPQQPLRNIYGDDLTVSGWGSTTCKCSLLKIFAIKLGNKTFGNNNIFLHKYLIHSFIVLGLLI